MRERRGKKIKLHFSNMHVAYWHDFYLTYALMYGSHHFLLSNYLLALHDLKAGNKVYGYYYTINLGPLYYSLYVIWCNAMDPTLNVSIKFFVSWLNQGTINLPHSKRYWNIQQFLNLFFHCLWQFRQILWCCFIFIYKLNISFDPCLYLFLDLQDFVHASEDQLCVDTPTSEDLIDDVGKHKNK